MMKNTESPEAKIRCPWCGSEPEYVAYEDFQRLLNNPGIVRNRQKIQSAIKNAGAACRIIGETGSFSDFLWRFVDGVPVRNAWTAEREIPVRSEQSDAMSSALRAAGFSFVGSTICYAFMQSVGMINDHLIGCFRYGGITPIA